MEKKFCPICHDAESARHYLSWRLENKDMADAEVTCKKCGDFTIKFEALHDGYTNIELTEEMSKAEKEDFEKQCGSRIFLFSDQHGLDDDDFFQEIRQGLSQKIRAISREAGRPIINRDQVVAFIQEILRSN